MLKLTIQKVDGQARDRQRIHDQVDEWLDAERNGCLSLEGKRAVKPKSNQQVKMIFGLMIESTIVQCNDLGIDISYLLKYLVDEFPKGQGITKPFLHQLMYVICPMTDDEGRRVTLSKMSTVQAANLFDSFRTILAPLGVVIQDPDPSWREKESE